MFTGVALVAAAAPAPAIETGRLRAPGPVGTVDTIAGPGFCSEGTGTPDPASASVGALAFSTSGAGTLWYEAGAPSEGLVAQVSGSASTELVRVGKAEPLQGRRSPGVAPLLSASRLASDPNDGFIVAGPRTIRHFIQLGALTFQAGTPDSVGGVNDADPTPDGTTLPSARFRSVAAVTTDGSGNIYVADEVDGLKSTIAVRYLNRSDQPVVFYPGTPSERSVAPGTIGTIVGGPKSPQGGGQAASPFVAAAPVLAAAAGRLYVAGFEAGPRPRATVRLVNLGGTDITAHGATVAAGAVSTVATVQGSPATLGSRVSPLPGIAVDGDGNLFLADRTNHRVLRVGQGGETTTVAGTGAAGFNGNDRPAVKARLNLPYDVEVGADGRVYISDAGNNQVRYIDGAGVIHAALGQGIASAWRCSSNAGPPAGAKPQPGNPRSVTTDTAGNAYVAVAPAGDRRLATEKLSQVFRVTPSASTSRVAGRLSSDCSDPSGCGLGDQVVPTAALLDTYQVEAGGGGLYINESTRVRFVNPTRRAMTIHGITVGAGAMRAVAGSFPPMVTTTTTTLPLRERLERPPGFTVPPVTTPQADGSKALGFELQETDYTAVAMDRGGNLLMAETPRWIGSPRGRPRIRQVDRRGTLTTVLVGIESVSNKIDTSGCCIKPVSLAVDPRGNLYIGDLLLCSGCHGQVWYFNRSSKPVTVHGIPVAAGSVVRVAGKATAQSLEEGAAAVDQPLTPWGLAVDRSGNLYVASGGDGHSVYRVDSRGVLTTVAGTGQSGFNGDGLKGPVTSLAEPVGVHVDTCGNLLIADHGNDRIRRFNLVAACPLALVASTSGTSGGRSLPRTWIITLVTTVLIGGIIVRWRWRGLKRQRE